MILETYFHKNTESVVSIWAYNSKPKWTPGVPGRGPAIQGVRIPFKNYWKTHCSGNLAFSQKNTELVVSIWAYNSNPKWTPGVPGRGLAIPEVGIPYNTNGGSMILENLTGHLCSQLLLPLAPSGLPPTGTRRPPDQLHSGADEVLERWPRLWCGCQLID